ncbi:hypothetical protein ABPG73_008185 [Tetrahymena malaccensis]
MGQKNSKNVIYFRNKFNGYEDFLNCKTVIDSRSIYLYLLNLDTALIKKACMKLSKCQNLSHLTICLNLQNGITPQQTKSFVLQLNEIHKSYPIHLELKGNAGQNAYEIIDEFRFCKSLTALKLSTFGSIVMPQLGLCLGQIESLQSLIIDCDYKYIKCTEGEVLGGIQFCRHLKNLSVSFTIRDQQLYTKNSQALGLSGSESLNTLKLQIAILTHYSNFQGKKNISISDAINQQYILTQVTDFEVDLSYDGKSISDLAESLKGCQQSINLQLKLQIQDDYDFLPLNTLNEITNLQNLFLIFQFQNLNEILLKDLYSKLACQEQLTKLSIESLDSNPIFIDELAINLRKNKKLTCFQLNMDIGQEKNLNFINSLTKIPNLQDLYLQPRGLNQVNLTGLGNQLSQLTNILFLHLDLLEFMSNNEGLCIMIDQLRYCQSLATLQIRIQIKDLNIRQLGDSLCQIQNLQNLKIDNSETINHSQSQEFYGIQSCKQIKSLEKLINLKLEFETYDTVDYSSLHYLNKVTVDQNLVLIFNFSQDKYVSAQSLYTQLSNLEQLTELKIFQKYGFVANPSYVADLSKNLSKCQKLRKLVFQRDIFEEGDLNSLGQLSQIQNLQELHLQFYFRNDMTPQQSQQFYNLLCQLPKSCSFHLSLQAGQSFNLYRMIDDLKFCKSLTTLILSKFKDIEMPKLGFYLGQIDSLESLKINCKYNQIACTEGEVLDGMRYCKNLKNLDFIFLNTRQFAANSKQFGLRECLNLTTLNFHVTVIVDSFNKQIEQYFRNLKKLKKLVKLNTKIAHCMDVDI